jgi:hypothetical protein
MSLLSRLVAVAALTMALAGCGSPAPALDTTAVEHAIASSILAQHRLNAEVDCPSDVERKAGVTFACTAKLDVGTYPVVVTEINNRGGVRYENRSRLAVLDVAKVRRAIGSSILDQRRLHSTVTCPLEVIQQAGVHFTCTATVAGRRYPVAVTELDSAGHVRYVARR